MYNWQNLRTHCANQSVFNMKLLKWIAEENLWNIWVPKAYNGLELPLTEGLHKLKELAQIDGSLGWTITLCSGANYFIGNLKPETAERVFLTETGNTILGGSGGMFGTAEKTDEHYILNGTWKYGTGAPYLTHFTLNAKITKNGKELLNNDGSAQFRSFVIPKQAVTVIDDWQTMGLQATATRSFSVKDYQTHQDTSFIYNEFQLPQAIFKINFSVFADLTLWINYIGMGLHYLEEAVNILESEQLKIFKENLDKAETQLFTIAAEIEKQTASEKTIHPKRISEIHQTASGSVKQLSGQIISLHPLLGIRAARKEHPLNQVFRDYFTATQHHIFTR